MDSMVKVIMSRVSIPIRDLMNLELLLYIAAAIQLLFQSLLGI